MVEVRRRGDGTRALRDRIGAWRAIGRSAVRLGRGARAAWLIRGLVLPALLLAATLPAGAAGPPLVLERIITLADVRGRIDHMAIDLARRRLIVAELGNNSVDVVDLASGKVLHRIGGQQEPQGVAYAERGDVILIAQGGDGSVRFFDAAGFAPTGSISLTDDADNIHLDPRKSLAVVAYGGGGLALIDPAARALHGTIALPAHPEGFALDAADGRAYVNIPGARQIVVADLDARRVIATWPVREAGANFPMALDREHGVLASALRSPPVLLLLDTGTGAVRQKLPLCNDADDVFFDARRGRLYASCGAGEVVVFARVASDWAELAAVPTAERARTALFVPELDRLFVAAPRGPAGAEAAIRIYRPTP